MYDLDSDGDNEIVAARHSVIYVWDSSGALVWRAPVGEAASTANNHGASRMYCSPVVGDLDNDSRAEIAVCYSNAVAVYEHDGSLKAGWPRTFPGPSGELRSIAGGDLDGDGRAEIVVVKTSDGPVAHVWGIDGTSRPGWPQLADHSQNRYDYGGYNQNVGIADLDGDMGRDIVCTYDMCHVGAFYPDGACRPADTAFADAGAFVNSVPMFHDIALARQGWGPDGSDRDEFTDSPPAFADMDGDGVSEIVLYSDYELAGEYVNRGNCLWVLNADMTRVAAFARPIVSGMPLFTGYQDNIVQVAPSPCIARLGNATPCVVVPSYDGHLRCYNNQAAELWRVQFDTRGGAFIGCGEAVAGDLDADGVSEVVFTTYSISSDVSYLVILNASGGLCHRVRIAGRGSMAAPTLADVDRDGVIEIVVSLKDVIGGGMGGVQVWRVESARAGLLEWPTGRGNDLRTGEAMGIR